MLKLGPQVLIINYISEEENLPSIGITNLIRASPILLQIFYFLFKFRFIIWVNKFLILDPILGVEKSWQKNTVEG